MNFVDAQSELQANNVLIDPEEVQREIDEEKRKEKAKNPFEKSIRIHQPMRSLKLPVDTRDYYSYGYYSAALVFYYMSELVLLGSTLVRDFVFAIAEHGVHGTVGRLGLLGNPDKDKEKPGGPLMKGNSNATLSDIGESMIGLKFAERGANTTN